MMNLATRSPRRSRSAAAAAEGQFSTNHAPRTLSKEEKLKILIEQARPLTEIGYDKAWLAIPKNRAFVEKKLPKMVFGRPAKIIGS